MFPILALRQCVSDAVHLSELHAMLLQLTLFPSRDPPHSPVMSRAFLLARSFNQPFPFRNSLLKRNQKDRLAEPHLALRIVSRDTRRARTRVADALDDAGDKGRAIELAHVARDGDEGVDERVVVGDHVLVGVAGGALEGVGGAAEEGAPEGGGDELEEREDAGGTEGGARGLAVEQEGEETHAQGVALLVEPVGADQQGIVDGQGRGLGKRDCDARGRYRDDTFQKPAQRNVLFVLSQSRQVTRSLPLEKRTAR